MIKQENTYLGADGLASVSYTHLDVYKRQILYRHYPMDMLSLNNCESYPLLIAEMLLIHTGILCHNGKSTAP